MNGSSYVGDVGTMTSGVRLHPLQLLKGPER